MKKHRLKTIAILAVCLMTAGCGPMHRNMNRSAVEPTQKRIAQGGEQASSAAPNGLYKAPSGSNQPANIPQGAIPTQQGQYSNTVAYIVNGDDFSATVTTEEEAMELSNILMDYAESGQHVCVGCASESDTLAKNVLITFSSASKVEVTYWVSNMIRRGYAVTIDYDKKTGVYNCTAYRKTTP